MENDSLHKLWKIQANDGPNFTPKEIITKAKKQRNGQYTSIAVMSITVVIIMIYIFFNAFNEWNTFNLGLILMITSLTSRIILEFYSLYRKEKQLISMAQKSYHAYLKTFYKVRQLIHFVITPICIALYLFGFYLLLPYFKEYFSEGFYLYILLSGILSLSIVIAIIINSILKEQRFLKQLSKG